MPGWGKFGGVGGGAMTETVTRFNGRVKDYERYRTRFPREVLERMRRHCGLTAAHVVADVGAGTGMLAELFLENGNAVIAVEPNAEMRAACERLKERYPKLSVVGAAAEATTLEDAAVDFVVVGRAFHWFDRARAIAEFARVLRGEKWVALVASHWSGDGSERAVEYEEILKTKGLDFQRVIGARLSRADMEMLFVPESLLVEQIDGEEMLTREALFGRTQSLSVTPEPGHAKYEEMQAALGEYFERWQEGGMIRVETTCGLTCGRIGAGW